MDKQAEVVTKNTVVCCKCKHHVNHPSYCRKHETFVPRKFVHPTCPFFISSKQTMLDYREDEYGEPWFSTGDKVLIKSEKELQDFYGGEGVWGMRMPFTFTRDMVKEFPGTMQTVQDIDMNGERGIPIIRIGGYLFSLGCFVKAKSIKIQDEEGRVGGIGRHKNPSAVRLCEFKSHTRYQIKQE